MNALADDGVVLVGPLEAPDMPPIARAKSADVSSQARLAAP